MKRRQLFRSRIGMALLFVTRFAWLRLSKESSGLRRKWASLIWVALLSLLLFGFQMQRSLALSGTLSGGREAPLICPPACGLLYSVDSTGDGDNIGSSNFCDDGTGHCTLRAAIDASNLHSGADGIGFNLPAGSVIKLTRVLPDVNDSVSIVGPGASLLTVQPDSNASTTFRIFNVTSTGTVTFSGLTISHGVIINGGGGAGILNGNGGTTNVTGCILIGNFTIGDGGAIANGGGTVNATNCAFVSNTTPAGSSAGGAIANGNGTTNITNCTFSGNSAGQGGGIANVGSGLVTVTSSTLSGNMAHSGGGGAITSLNGTIRLSNCTIAGNILDNSPSGGAGGISNSGGTVNVKGTLVASNTATGFSVAQDVSGTFISQGFNLIGKNDGAAGSFPVGNPNVNNDVAGTVAAPIDPKLDSNGLQDNGGPTQTIALLPGSPAIDRGTSAGFSGNLTTDQRGFARTFDDPNVANASGGDGTDIGAYEVETAASTPTPTPTSTPTPIPGQLGNISTRLRVETGDNVLIGGFIVTGTQPKRIILRAIGPSLTGAGVPGALANPTLELHDSSQVLASNDNWMDAPNRQEIIDSTLAPTNDLESAILMTLPANNAAYTAIVSGVNNSAGVGLVEAYDLDQTANSKLANISTRGLVQTDANVMIGGFIVVGNTPKRVIVRAIGPSLPVADKLADPILELHDGNGTLLQSNDNWMDAPNRQEIIDSTLAPTNDLESAILMTLPANNSAYTAIVRGANNATGVGLVEAYALN
jgi:hypothetical protein